VLSKKVVKGEAAAAESEQYRMLFVQSKDKTSAFNYVKSLCGRSAGQVTDKKTGFTGDIDRLCQAIREIVNRRGFG
jgi:hypothetical protein